MNKAILTVFVTGVAAISLSVSSAAFAGNNGGAGNAHGAEKGGCYSLEISYQSTRSVGAA